jgi:hypothetical protein
MTEDRRAPMESSFRTESQSLLRVASNSTDLVGLAILKRAEV